MTRVVWIYAPADHEGTTLILAEHDSADGQGGGIYHVAQSRELAAHWAQQLRRGQIPTNDPETAS